MKKPTHLCFSVWNSVIQDGNTTEYHIADRTLFSLEAHTDTPLQSSKDKITLTQIQDNQYEVCGYIYEVTCAYALININGLKLSLCNNKDADYTPNQIYKGTVTLSYNPWGCYGMNVCNDQEDESLYSEGIVENIHLITSPHLNNIALDKTSSWDDENNHKDATSNYIIDVSLCEDKQLCQAPHPLQIDKQKLVLNLKNISPSKITEIEKFIESVIFD